MDMFRVIRTGSTTCAAIIGGCLVPTGSQAVDLPAEGATLIESVRTCSAHGTGFFTIPGTDTACGSPVELEGKSGIWNQVLAPTTPLASEPAPASPSTPAPAPLTACCGPRRSTSSPAIRAITGPTPSVLTKLSSSSAD